MEVNGGINVGLWNEKIDERGNEESREIDNEGAVVWERAN